MGAFRQGLREIGEINVRSTSRTSSARSESRKLGGLSRRFGIVATLWAVLALALPVLASADPLTGTPTFFTGLRPTAWVYNLTAGPDGNVWFVDGREIAGTSAIGKITPSGTITEYVEGESLSGLNTGAKLTGITVGPGKKLWLTDWGTTPGIVVIDPASPGVATEYSAGLNEGSVPQGIVKGPDGNAWFADAGKTPAIGRITPGGVITEFSAGLTATDRPRGIVVGSDGNLWFTDASTGTEKAIGRFDMETLESTKFETGASSTPGGSPAEFGPWGIALGSDNNVWFTGKGGEGSPAIGRITPSGEVTSFSSGLPTNSGPLGLVATPNGKLWFTDNGGITEQQKIKFEETWATGNEFELCNEAKSKCVKKAYSTTATTTRNNVKSAFETMYGAGAVNTPSCSGVPITCTVTFSEEGPQVDTNVGQTSCTKLTGTGKCQGETSKQGAPNGIGSITTSGEIERYTFDGRFTAAGDTCSEEENVWFSGGVASMSYIAKFGIGEKCAETGPTNLVTLTVTKSPAPNAGSGTGSVASKPKGIKCGTTCDEAVARMYKNTPVVLTAKPGGETSSFVKWVGGPCNGKTETTCTMPMANDEEVEAVFAGTSKAFSPGEALTVSKGESEENGGKGTVKGPGLGCEAECSSTVVLIQGPVTEPKIKPGKIVVLKQAPAFGSVFTGWSGCESEPEGNCQVTMETAKEVVAEYEALPNKVLTVNKTYSSGNGSVSSKPKGIACAATCTQSVAQMPEGAKVELVAKPGTETTFVKWEGGDCEGSTNPVCVVTMNADETTKAVFSKAGKAFLSGSEPALTLNKAGSGFGTVKASGIKCEVLCSSQSALYQGPLTEPKVKPGKTVILKATSAPGSKAVAWSGCDSVTEAGECVVEMDEAHAVTATFDELE